MVRVVFQLCRNHREVIPFGFWAVFYTRHNENSFTEHLLRHYIFCLKPKQMIVDICKAEVSKQRDLCACLHSMLMDVIMYTADSKNIHSVDEITKGERITLTLWFSRDASHDEDTKLLKSLSECSVYSPESMISSYFPVPASNNMYWFPPEEASKFQSGLDIRYGRLSVLGFSISSSDEKSCLMAPDSSSNFLNLLNDPLHLVCGDELLVMEFVNILHALQIVQFYYWKVSESKTAEPNGPSVSVKPISETQLPIINSLKDVFLKDSQLAEMLFGRIAGGRSLQWSFDSVTFSSVLTKWEAYTYNLRKQLAMSLPHWKTHRSIFSVVSLD